jgi:uncharacterized membrane protein YkvA (DUF1232 family)
VTAIVISLAVVVGLYAAFVAALVLSGRRAEARAVARLVGDCARLAGGLACDARVPRRWRLALAVLVAYLACPIDLVPDVIPVAGVLDDALVAVLVLRGVVRSAGPAVVGEHWPGSPRTLDVILRAAGA